MSDYLPVLRQLNLDNELSNHLPEIVPTHNGALFTEDKDHVYLLYRYIDGYPIGKGELTESEVDQLADLLGRLHTYHADVLPGQKLTNEDFRFELSAQLQSLRTERWQELPSDLREILSGHNTLLDQALEKLESLSITLKSANRDFCLVHADMHTWNLMCVGDSLVLLDLEDIRFSLPELDLMFLIDKPYYARFLARYKRQHPEFETNLDAVRFFWLRRDLTDVAQFSTQIAFENLGESTRAEALHWLRVNLINLRHWLQR